MSMGYPPPDLGYSTPPPLLCPLAPEHVFLGYPACLHTPSAPTSQLWSVQLKSPSWVSFSSSPSALSHTQSWPSPSLLARRSGPLTFCRHDIWIFYLRGSQIRASLATLMVKNLPAMQETQVWSLGWEEPLAKGTATHSSILAWRIPWTEEHGGL